MDASDRPRVITLGEPLLVLRVPPGHSLETASNLEVLLGGAECNVAIGCSRLGLDAAWIGKVQADPIGYNLVRRLRSEAVDVSGVVWSHAYRTGIMFSEIGVYPRPNRVIYDRRESAAASLVPEEINWAAFTGASHVHLTGITAALGDRCQRMLLRVAEETQRIGATVSYDVNHREKMWSTSEARQFYEKLNPWIDILFLNLDESRILLDSPATDPGEILDQLHDQWRRPVTVLTLGERGSCAWTPSGALTAPGYVIQRINRFGAGDAFVAGFLSQYLRSVDLEAALRHGGAAAALKMTFSCTNHPMFTADQVSYVAQHGLVQHQGTVQTQSYTVDR